jgi:hypothetical protein
MVFASTRVLSLVFVFLVNLIHTTASASTLNLVIAEDSTKSYSRSLFKHWIDADNNGCNTRAEVLIEEAIVKPKIGTKCKLTGGRWLSVYDGKIITNASQLDVDHMVPLAEAWRSGAWKWNSAQRQAFANDLENAEALIAVTPSTNRGKGDKDPSLWLPANDKCTYIQNWISVKVKYSLTVDAIEAATLNSLLGSCDFANSNSPTPTPVPTPIVSNSPTPEAIPTPIQNTTPSTSAQIITPGAFCAPAGAIGVSKTGVAYSCKTSSTDTRNRWRQ